MLLSLNHESYKNIILNAGFLLLCINDFTNFQMECTIAYSKKSKKISTAQKLSLFNHGFIFKVHILKLTKEWILKVVFSKNLRESFHCRHFRCLILVAFLIEIN